jgi:transposase
MNAAGEAVVLKSDAVGRVKRSRSQRERLLDEFERSGLSGTKFAALAGIKYQTFAFWAQRRRKARAADGSAKVPAASADQVRWLEAVVEQAQNPSRTRTTALVVHLPGGARLEIADVQQAVLAAAFVRALEHPATSC